MRLQRMLVGCGAAVCLAAAAGPAAAEDWAILGARARGMGGAGVATEMSSYWNPASIGLPIVRKAKKGDTRDPLATATNDARRRGGSYNMGFVGLATFEIAALGDIAKEVDDIADYFFERDFAAIQDRMNAGLAGTDPGSSDPFQDLRDVLGLIEQIQDLDQDGVGVYGSAVAESGIWIKTDVISVGFFVRGVGYAGIDPVVDWSFLAASAIADGGFAEVFAVTGTAGSPTTSQGTALSTALQAQGVSGPEADTVAAQAEMAGINLSDPGTFNALVAVGAATVQAGTAGTATPLDTLFYNQSGFWLRGVIMKEAGITLSRAHEMGGIKFSLGVSFKFVEAITNQNLIAVSRFQDGEQVFDKLLDDWHRSRDVSTTFGIDAGAMIELPIGLRIGVTGRNLTRPIFSWEGSQSYYIERQWRAGAAWELGPLTLAFDADLWVTQSRLVERYDSQFLSGGIEFNPAKHSPVGVAVRIGAYQNVAEPTEDLVFTFGLGIRLGPITIDAAVSSTFTTTDVETAENIFDKPPSDGIADFEELYPERFGASAVISVSYPF